MDDLFESTHKKAFEVFHEANPHVYTKLVGYAQKVRATGRTRYGIATLYEVLRYRTDTTSQDPFRLNNNHKAWYARKMMDRGDVPEGFFQLRRSAADDS